MHHALRNRTIALLAFVLLAGTAIAIGSGSSSDVPHRHDSHRERDPASSPELGFGSETTLTGVETSGLHSRSDAGAVERGDAFAAFLEHVRDSGSYLELLRVCAQVAQPRPDCERLLADALIGGTEWALDGPPMDCEALAHELEPSSGPGATYEAAFLARASVFFGRHCRIRRDGELTGEELMACLTRDNIADAYIALGPYRGDRHVLPSQAAAAVRELTSHTTDSRLRRAAFYALTTHPAELAEAVASLEEEHWPRSLPAIATAVGRCGGECDDIVRELAHGSQNRRSAAYLAVMRCPNAAQRRHWQHQLAGTPQEDGAELRTLRERALQL